MRESDHRIAFGPIPSRRLGRSLGVNTIPAKVCTYGCPYCQAGVTTERTLVPRAFFSARQVLDAVAERLALLRRAGQDVDFLSFVPDGEPTLDSGLGESIDALRPLGVPIAVITNATLLGRADVRARVRRADLVSVKVDSVLPTAWQRVNHPHPDLRLVEVLDGVRQFASEYSGTLLTETMLVAGANDGLESLEPTAEFLATVGPRTAYLAVPLRPPAVAGTRGPDEPGLVRAHEVYSRRLPSVELLTGHEPGRFGHTGDAREDLLATTAVHPIREAAARELLAADSVGWDVVDALVAEGRLREVDYGGQRYLVRPPRPPR